MWVIEKLLRQRLDHYMKGHPERQPGIQLLSLHSGNPVDTTVRRITCTAQGARQGRCAVSLSSGAQGFMVVVLNADGSITTRTRRRDVTPSGEHEGRQSAALASFTTVRT
jgi:hypothetical protein